MAKMKTQLPDLAFYYTRYQNNNDSNVKAYKKWNGRVVNLGTVTVENVAQNISDKGCVTKKYINHDNFCQNTLRIAGFCTRSGVFSKNETYREIRETY